MADCVILEEWNDTGSNQQIKRNKKKEIKKKDERLTK